MSSRYLQPTRFTRKSKEQESKEAKESKEAVDIISLPPVRCVTCGKVMREKYYDLYEELVNTKLNTEDLLLQLYKELAMIIMSEYQIQDSIESTIKSLKLEKLYHLIRKKETSIQSLIEEITFVLEEQANKLLKQGKTIDEILERLDLDDLLFNTYQKLRSYKYKPEDVFVKLNLTRPCCRLTIARPPKMANPSYIGENTGYDLDPGVVEEIVEEVSEPERIPEPEPKSKGASLKNMLLKAKEKKKENPTIKKVSKYYAI